MTIYESWLSDENNRPCLRLMAPGRLLLTVREGHVEAADDITPDESREVIKLLADAVSRYVLGRA